jgi:hypothetical protein
MPKNCSVTMPTDQSILVQPAVILWQIQNNCSNTNKKNQDRQNETNITRCPAWALTFPPSWSLQENRSRYKGKLTLNPSANKYRNWNEDGWNYVWIVMYRRINSSILGSSKPSMCEKICCVVQCIISCNSFPVLENSSHNWDLTSYHDTEQETYLGH